MTAPVLMLGGYGSVGSRISRMLRRLQPDLPIAIVGRDLPRAEDLADQMGNATAGIVDLERVDLGLPRGADYSIVVTALRDLNREQVRTMLTRCLQRSAGSYRDCLLGLGVRSDEYLRAMDFLRFHDLKPHSYRRAVRGRTLPSPRHFTSDDRSIVLVSP